MDRLLQLYAAELQGMLADPVQWVALAAAAAAAVLIVASTLVKTIIPLRWLALGGNLGFVVYGALHPSLPVLVLHLALLPINLWRVIEMQRLTRRVLRAADARAELKVWLQPYMRRRRLRAGETVFRQGDSADRLYVLAEGELEVADGGRRIAAGQMFGEIAFFAPERRRTATVRAVVASTVLSIDETTFRQLFFQNPAFGFEVVGLVASHLTADVRRLEEYLAQGTRGDPAEAAQAAAPSVTQGAAPAAARDAPPH
jgi:CRP-like cAMP-binding protein